MASIEERASAGAQFLDQKRPGWYRKIVVKRLDIGNCENCVLGQLYGGQTELKALGYGTGLQSLGFDGSNGGEYGFGIMIRHKTKEGQTREFDQLTEAWKREIKFRREIDNAARRVKRSGVGVDSLSRKEN